MYRNTFLSVMFLACCFNGSLCAQSDAQIYERTCDAKTYPFSDPSPVATPNNSYYPYFRFDGFSMQAQEKQWKMVVLENDYETWFQLFSAFRNQLYCLSFDGAKPF